MAADPDFTEDLLWKNLSPEVDMFTTTLRGRVCVDVRVRVYVYVYVCGLVWAGGAWSGQRPSSPEVEGLICVFCWWVCLVCLHRHALVNPRPPPPT